jgi:branched-subunit amino acid aminotransferase/4-amino-4-deoxychorismate lyase
MDGVFFMKDRVVCTDKAVISVMDQGVQFGWGLFETIKVYNGMPRLLDRHLHRLFSSASELKISHSTNKEKLAGNITDYIRAVGSSSFILKIVLTKGTGEVPNIFFTSRAIPYSAENYRSGFSAGISSIRRNESSPLVYMKTLNCLENIIARQGALEQGYNEALFINTKGFLSEGSISNIFFAKDLKVFTPRVECGLLPGIVREEVIHELAPELGIDVIEGEFPLEALLEADEAFLTNSGMEIMPLSRVNGVKIGSGKTGAITAEIKEKYDKHVLP